jgi:hypothetical protein
LDVIKTLGGFLQMAEWSAAIGTVLAIAWGVLSWSRDRHRALYQEESRQARGVAIVVQVVEVDPAPACEIHVTITNTSDLPVRDIRTTLYETTRGGLRSSAYLSDHPPDVAILLPGDHIEMVVNARARFAWQAHIGFDDDNNIRWIKNTSSRPALQKDSPARPQTFFRVGWQHPLAWIKFKRREH